jgi:hypothetical protein
MVLGWWIGARVGIASDRGGGRASAFRRSSTVDQIEAESPLIWAEALFTESS